MSAHLNQAVVWGVATSCTVSRQLRVTLSPTVAEWLPGWPGITTGGWATTLSTLCTNRSVDMVTC